MVALMNSSSDAPATKPKCQSLGSGLRVLRDILMTVKIQVYGTTANPL